jgi:hypothetical protein
VGHDVKTLALPKHCNEFIQGNYLGPSQDEFDADAEIFVRAALLWELRVGGQVLLTTSEHPFYVPGVGWKTLRELQVGERLLCEDGSTLPIEGVRDKLKWQTVYNFRVANWHTYFVGCDSWGWAAWAHNSYSLDVNRPATHGSTGTNGHDPRMRQIARHYQAGNPHEAMPHGVTPVTTQVRTNQAPINPANPNGPPLVAGQPSAGGRYNARPDVQVLGSDGKV